MDFRLSSWSDAGQVVLFWLVAGIGWTLGCWLVQRVLKWRPAPAKEG